MKQYGKRGKGVAMAKKSTLKRINIITLLAFAAFGLVAIAMTYQALIAPTRTEPKAAEVSTLYKRWEFNGTTTENWSGEGVALAVKNGSLVATVQRNDPSVTEKDVSSSEDVKVVMLGSAAIRNDSVGTTMPRGIKYFTLRLSATGNWINPVMMGTAGAVTDGVISDSEETDPAVQGVSTETNTDGAVCDPIFKCREGDERICTILRRIPGWCRWRPMPMPRPSCIPRPPCLDANSCDLDENRYCPPGVVPSGKTIILALTYNPKNGITGGRPLIIKAVADGTFHTYKARFPEIEEIDLASLRLHFLGAARYADMTIDWMRLSGSPVSVPSVRPTPVVTCIPRPKCLDADPPCNLQPPNDGLTWCKTPPYPTPPKGCRYVQVQCVKAPCDPVLVCPTPPVRPTSKNGGCVTGGCSGQLCVDEGAPPIYTTCEYKEEYACYKKTTCKRQENGVCGWTETPELTECLEKARTATD